MELAVRVFVIQPSSVLRGAFVTLFLFDSLVTRLGIDESGLEKRTFRIEEYRDTFVGAAVTAGEINKVLQSLERYLDPDIGRQKGSSADAALHLFDQRIERWIVLVFTALVVLILFVAIVAAGVLFIYRRKIVWTEDPHTRFWRRLGVFFIGLLPIESQL